jgi:hypothetical protein
MKISVFTNVTPCGFCRNRRFGGMYRLHHQGDKNRQARNNVTVTSNRGMVLTRVTRRNVPEGGILQHCL